MWNSYTKAHTVRERSLPRAAYWYVSHFGCRNAISPGRSRVRRRIFWWNTLSAHPPKLHWSERHAWDRFDMWHHRISVTRRRSVYRRRQTPKGCGGRSIRFTLVCPDRVWTPTKHMVSNNSESPRQLCNWINQILHRRPAPSLPNHVSIKSLCDSFSSKWQNQSYPFCFPRSYF